MADEWRRHSLGDLCSLITDGKHGDCRNEAGSGYYFLSVKDVLDNRLVYENARQITESDFIETHRRTNLEAGDVLFTNTGTIGRMAIVPDDPRTRRTTFQKSVAILKPRRNLVEPHFLYYTLKFDNTRLSELAAGTTQKNLLLKDFRSFKVKIPDIEEQRAIAHILGTLDDKIELNRRMNETLEAMARALFKSWFVDFDPVRAKAEGRAPGLPKPLADLFPARLVDSEFGAIPEGWDVKAFADTVDIIGGGTPKTSVAEYWGGEIPWFSVVDAPLSSEIWVVDTEKKVTQRGVDACSTRVLPVGTAIISARGTVGRVALVGVPMAMNQSCYGLRGKQGTQGFFNYFATRSLVAVLRQRAHGSVFDTITRDTLAGIPTVVPTDPVVEGFEHLSVPLVERVLKNALQSQTLAAVRDALLPKLISGELRVKDAERIAESVA